MKNKKKVSVLFVCLGNICRSPTAQGVFTSLVAQQGLAGQIVADSAGTAAYHLGKPADLRAQRAAVARGYDLSALRARQVSEDDFRQFDYILAMDEANLAELKHMAPPDATAQLGRLLDYGHCREHDVPDPYYGGPGGFEQVLDLVENASRGLLMVLTRSNP